MLSGRAAEEAFVVTGRSEITLLYSALRICDLIHCEDRQSHGKTDRQTNRLTGSVDRDRERQTGSL